MENRKLNVTYYRLSLKDINKYGIFSDSIMNQRIINKSFADRMGITIDKEYIDDGYSGMNFDRPGFDELMKDINEGKIGLVITKDMSRLGRDLVETMYYVCKFFPQQNVRYISIEDKYDSDDSDASYLREELSRSAFFNEDHVRKTSIKRTATAEMKTSQGDFIGFIAPYGYKIVKQNGKRTLEIDENVREIVERIFCEKADNKTRKEIADGLNNDKIPPPFVYLKMTRSQGKYYSNKWTSGIIYRIIRNEIYLGNLVVRKSKKTNFRQKKRDYIPYRDQQVIENNHPPIISRKLFEDANSKINYASKAKNKTNYNGLFANMIICGECGRIMNPRIRVRDNGNIQYQFNCPNKANLVRKKCNSRSIHDSKLEKIVSDVLKEKIQGFVDEGKLVDDIAKNVSDKRKVNNQITKLQQSIQSHNNKIKELYIKKSKGEIDVDYFIKEKNKESELRKKCQIQIEDITTNLDLDKKRQEIILQYNKFINEGIMTREYIRKLIKRIIVYKDGLIEIEFQFGIGNTKKIKLY